MATAGPSSQSATGTTVILSLGLAISSIAAIVFAVLYFTKPGPSHEGRLVKQDPLLQQRDTVSPKGKFSDVVVFPIPYRSMPNLKLTSAKRQFEITKQDEKGFTWTAKPLVEDIKDDKGFGAERMARDYPLWYLQSEGYLGKTAPEIEDFTWEAKGLPAANAAK
jgi:hypothetical protein